MQSCMCVPSFEVAGYRSWYVQLTGHWRPGRAGGWLSLVCVVTRITAAAGFDALTLTGGVSVAVCLGTRCGGPIICRGARPGGLPL